MTLIGNGGVSDSLWGQVRKSSEEREIVQLLMAIAAINVWNRLAVSFTRAFRDKRPNNHATRPIGGMVGGPRAVCSSVGLRLFWEERAR
ncbi:hypothetical protein [Cryobacterium serini]|uniref:Uncharacterized protein n=1 Tax=Cryobacterium serini TaxID=1259201 RepID=A0A4R9BMC2_9MICO|nr:hypothetical protein [Cryobacterium serini]TFD86924.1 hypothetical protein E3T51_10830 [Cryobacterium serini]